MGVSDSLVNSTAFPLGKVPRETKQLEEEVRVSCGGYADQWSFNITVKRPKDSVPNADKALLYVHGNGETIYSVDEFLQTVADRLRMCVFSFDIPGYGTVPGKPSEDALVECAQRTLYFMKRRGFQTHDVVVWARSLGSVAGIRLAGVNNVGHLILEAPLASGNDALRVPVPIRITQFNNLEHFPLVRCGVTIVCGSRDETLDVRNNGLKLYKSKAAQLAAESREECPEIVFQEVQGTHGKLSRHAYKNIQIFLVDGGHHNDLNAFFREELLAVAAHAVSGTHF